MWKSIKNLHRSMEIATRSPIIPRSTNEVLKPSANVDFHTDFARTGMRQADPTSPKTPQTFFPESTGRGKPGILGLTDEVPARFHAIPSVDAPACPQGRCVVQVLDPEPDRLLPWPTARRAVRVLDSANIFHD
jgi:hypothetical protein